jgi:hypothetical protein
MIAPHTTTSRLGTIAGAAFGGLVAGAMRGQGERRRWWLPLSVIGVLLYGMYAGRAILVNEANGIHVILGSFIDWSAILLFILPTRTYFSRCLTDERMSKVSLGLFGGTWIAAGLTHLCTGVFVYAIINWPNAVWLAIAPIAPVEHTIRALVGMLIGTGVIAGLRAIGLVKPTQALY